MRIRKMTATFGSLHRAVLEPGPDLTLIQAPNESGKSTWCAFLRSMLYGFPARDRDKAGYIAEKTRWQPWSGAAMEGSVELEWKGRGLTLRRGPKGATPWGSFSAVWTATGEAVDGLTADNCGETLLGVSREVFERTAFVGQGNILLSPSGDLEKRVAALAGSGDEEVSSSQVERRLKDWLNRRRVNSRVGLLPELESELAQVDAARTRQEGALRQYQEFCAKKELLEQEKTAIDGKLAALDAQEQAQLVKRRKQAQADHDKALRALSTAQAAAAALPSADELRRVQGDLSYLSVLDTDLRAAQAALPQAEERSAAAQAQVEADPIFSGTDIAQAAVQVQQDRDEARRLEKNSSLFLFLLLGALLGGILGGLLASATPEPLVQLGFSLGFISNCVVSPAAMLWLLPPCILLGAAVVGGIAALKNHGRRKKAAALLSRYGAQSPEDIQAKGAAYQEKYTAAQDAQRELQAALAQRDKLSAQKEELTRQFLTFVRNFAPETADLDQAGWALAEALRQGEVVRLAQARVDAARQVLSALPDPGETGEPVQPLPLQPPTEDRSALTARQGTLASELSYISDAAARLQGELSSLGDPAELNARRGALLEELEKRQGEYDAISAALESLKTADSLLRERFSPQLNAKTGEYLAALTGGRYQGAALTRQFQATATAAGEVSPRQDLTLSSGTAQQLYLAARLAMCELALPETESCPILLDDVLDAFDDARAKLAVECLEKVAEKRQVLLFTCHGRDASFLETGQTVTL